MEYAYRQAAESDIQALTDIYNAAVVAGGSSADTTPRTIEQRRAWLDSHKAPYAVFVTEAVCGDGIRQVVGFSALSVFYDRAGYNGVTDLAYYIAPEWQGRGVGTFTLRSLLDEARKRHMRKACGIIFADNAGRSPKPQAGLGVRHSPVRRSSGGMGGGTMMHLGWHGRRQVNKRRPDAHRGNARRNVSNEQRTHEVGIWRLISG